ncbi:MAG: aminoacyl-tRNA hydrolase [Elusimicrobia bacterium]|nr:aminoacyl-tRNA hydrolase [Elusimicrobiota bacterium]
MRLVVGLGNPGPRYARTRHNVGWRLVDFLAGPDAAWKNFKGLGACADAGGFLLAKPETFMNDSGRFVRAFAAFRRISPAEILVCYDELDLPFGRLRLKPSGSAAGHKGMGSIIAELGTEEIPRLRLGVGPKPPQADGAAFVLGRFSPDEEKTLGGVLEAAAQAARLARAEGLEAAMNRFNGAAAP